MATLIVASTGPRTGKTAVAAGLAARLAKDGVNAALGAPSAEAQNELASIVGGVEVVHAHSGAVDALDRSAAAIREAEGRANAVVVEGSTGTPVADLRLAAEVDGLVLLVGAYGDDLVEEAAAYGGRLAGVVVNNVPQYRHHDVETRLASALSEAGVRLLGWLPETRRLLAPTVDLVAAHLDGNVVMCPENGRRLIDNFLIGGLVLDWAPHYFSSQENVGVIVRGDRPDVQLAALQTDSVQALALTKGIPPIEYVYYEAKVRGAPIIVAPGDTHETAAMLDTLLPSIPFDHPDKVDCMAGLIAERLDTEVIKAALAEPVTR